MKEKFFNFNDQKIIGDIGESHFLKVYEGWEPKKSLADFRIDFILNDGKTVELKTDNYDMEKTTNFFMEKQTISGTKNSIGGPWRSKEHNVDYFVYYFVNNKTFFWFFPTKLCEFLDGFIKEKNLNPITIPNKDNRGGYYEAIGFKIPRDSVTSVLLKEHKVI